MIFWDGTDRSRVNKQPDTHFERGMHIEADRQTYIGRDIWSCKQTHKHTLRESRMRMPVDRQIYVMVEIMEIEEERQISTPKR